MAPSRRKGASKVSLAAAARKKWKIGDLVLAKVKGFPPWPATVSEPEKWGYSTDWKKVLVYFFGTKQIAFCNPADVEAFTEEKKKTLLVKRQGKGADFVRAVDEIIDSYEKSKRQDIDDESNSGDEGIVSNAGSWEDCKSKSQTTSLKQSPNSVHNPRSETLSSSIDRSGSCNPVEISADMVEISGLHDVEDHILDHHGETSLPTVNSLKKRSRDAPHESCVLQRPTSVQRCRSSSRVEPFKLQKSTHDADKASGDLVTSVILEESLRRGKLIRRSPDSPVCNDMHSLVCSAALVPSGSSEDIGSGIVAQESESTDFNEGSTLESTEEVEHPGIANYSQIGIGLTGRLSLRHKAVVLKKKRKPNRKPATHVTVASDRPKKGTDLEFGMNIDLPSSIKMCEKSDQTSHKTDGDEHLPLVKRARARMGKPSSEDKQLGHSEDSKEKPSQKFLMGHLEAGLMSSNCSDTCLSGGTSLAVNEKLDNSSPVNNYSQCRGSGPQYWKVTRCNMRSCSVDGEAALPPSKRLHRALEAMSANAAEAGDTCAESPRTIDVPSNWCMSGDMSSLRNSPDSKAGNLLHAKNSHSSDYNNLCNGASAFFSSSVPSTPNLLTKTRSEVKPENFSSLKHEESKEMVMEAENHMPSKNLHGSSINSPTAEVEIHVRRQQSYSFHSDEKLDNGELIQSRLNASLPVIEEIDKEILELKKDYSDDVLNGEDACCECDEKDVEHETAQPVLQSQVSVSRTKDIGQFVLTNGNGMLSAIPKQRSLATVIPEDVKILRTQSDENSKVREMYGVAKEVKGKLTPKDRDFFPYSTSMKVLIATAASKRRLCHSISICDSVSDDKAQYDTVSNVPPSHGVESSERTFSSYSSVHNSASDDRNMHDGSRSPDMNLNQMGPKHSVHMDDKKYESILTQRQKPLSKLMGHVEANTAWKSFEAMLDTLSRTKESIGRATRLAIDCAKYGIAGDVVELLLQSLETEPNLHRRVDLFFLVDSITQCSRGQRADVGDVYPSAIEAVLPRLLSAAAPPGNAARENRRQCLKVLRLWLERKTLPESIVRHHMRELESSNDVSVGNVFSRRPARMERAFDDPLREMDGMLVDEYGSNTSFQLPGFLIPRMIEDEDEGCGADEKSFEAVTPECDLEVADEPETTTAFTAHKHRHILEDVDGELEMEDVAPSCDGEMNSRYHAAGVDTVHAPHCHFDQQHSLPFRPPLPEDRPPSPPPLPSSPLPVAPPPPPPPPPLPSSSIHHFADTIDSHLHRGIHRMQGQPSQSVGEQPNNAQNVSAVSLDRVPYSARGYGDPQIQRPIRATTYVSGSYNCGPTCHPSVKSVSNVQHIGGAPLPNNAYHLQPPRPTVSDQFSYVQADMQQTESWKDCSSSPFFNGAQSVREMCHGNFLGHQGKMDFTHHEMEERSRFSSNRHSGSAALDKAEPSYNHAPLYGRTIEPSPISDPGWSFLPRASNTRSSLPSWQSPLENPTGLTRASNFWRPI